MARMFLRSDQGKGVPKVKEEGPFEPIRKIRPGDRVLRRRRPWSTLRLTPVVPGFPNAPISIA